MNTTGLLFQVKEETEQILLLWSTQTECLHAERHHGKHRKPLYGTAAGPGDGERHHFLSEPLLECGSRSNGPIRGESSLRETDRQEVREGGAHRKRKWSLLPLLQGGVRGHRGVSAVTMECVCQLGCVCVNMNTHIHNPQSSGASSISLTTTRSNRRKRTEDLKRQNFSTIEKIQHRK